MTKTKITDLDSLQAEKKRLKKLCTEAGNNLNADVNFLKENYQQMTVNLVLPFEKNTNSTVTRILDLLDSKFVDSLLGVPRGEEKSRTMEQVGLRLLQMLVLRLGYAFIKNKFTKKQKASN